MKADKAAQCAEKAQQAKQIIENFKEVERRFGQPSAAALFKEAQEAVDKEAKRKAKNAADRKAWRERKKEQGKSIATLTIRTEDVPVFAQLAEASRDGNLKDYLK